MDLSFVSTFLQIIAQTLQIYSFVLIVRVLLTWFPNVDMGNPVLSTVSSITDVLPLLASAPATVVMFT